MSISAIVLFWVALACAIWAIIANSAARSATKKYKKIRQELDITATYVGVEEKIELANESLKLAQKDLDQAVEKREKLIASFKNEAREALEKEEVELQKRIEHLSNQGDELDSLNKEVDELKAERDRLSAEVQNYRDIVDGDPLVIDMERCRHVIDTLISEVGIGKWSIPLSNQKKRHYKAELGWLCRRGYVHSYYIEEELATYYGLNPKAVSLNLDHFDLKYAKWKKRKEELDAEAAGE